MHLKLKVIISEIISTVYSDELKIDSVIEGIDYGTKTPFTIRITDPHLLGQFKAGQIFYLDFTPV